MLSSTSIELQLSSFLFSFLILFLILIAYRSSKTKKIFVGGVSQDTTLEDVQTYFSQFGKVRQAHSSPLPQTGELGMRMSSYFRFLAWWGRDAHGPTNQATSWLRIRHFRRGGCRGQDLRDSLPHDQGQEGQYFQIVLIHSDSNQICFSSNEKVEIDVMPRKHVEFFF